MNPYRPKMNLRERVGLKPEPEPVEPRKMNRAEFRELMRTRRDPRRAASRAYAGRRAFRGILPRSEALVLVGVGRRARERSS